MTGWGVQLTFPAQNRAVFTQNQSDLHRGNTPNETRVPISRKKTAPGQLAFDSFLGSAGFTISAALRINDA
jgi:hypothetical protein